MSKYAVYIIPQAWKEVKTLPGNLRQRVRQAIEGWGENPRLPRSSKLETEGFDVELRRIRLDKWRVIYAITEADQIVDVLAIRKRPPYDYGDLAKLIKDSQ